MEEDAEVLDWGNEDDEMQSLDTLRGYAQQNQSDGGVATGGDFEEAEDAVSLGGDEDEEADAYASVPDDSEQVPVEQDGSTYPPLLERISVDEGIDVQQESSGRSTKPPSRKAGPTMARRSQSVGKLTHALPPKPIVAPPPFIPTTTVHPTTLASSMIYRERRANGISKPLSNSQDTHDALPPDWEVRYPRNGGREGYFYNTRTHESTWTRPGTTPSDRSSPSRDNEDDRVLGTAGRSPARGVVDDSPRSIRKDIKRRVSPGGSLSYEDRHYTMTTATTRY